MSLALTTVAVALPPMPAAAADAPTGGDKRVRAFVLSNLYPAGDGGSCPILSQSSLDLFAKSLTPEEQKKYVLPGESFKFSTELGKRLGFRRLGVGVQRQHQAKLPPGFDPSLPMTFERAKEIGAYNGFPKDRGRPAWIGKEVVYNSCSNPEDFPQLDVGHRLYEGKVAAGMNLDGKVGREDFVGLDGSRGVDNQLWRAVGCVKSFRDSTTPDETRTAILSALAPTLVEIRDIDDIRNDPDVTITVYAAAETVARDGKGGTLARATFTPQPDPRLTATTRGRIVDGVLSSDPFDFRSRLNEQGVLDTVREFRGARIRAVFNPEGGIEGSINGYQTLASFWEYMEQRTQDSAYTTGYSCPAVHNAIHRLADGYRDPRTGRYSAISSSYNFQGVRAFVAQPIQTAASEVTQ
jgi:hypothetical protein